MKKSVDLSTPLRAHVYSAGIGALYVLLLHLAVWLSFSVAWLAVPENGNHLPIVVVPACIMLIGLIALVVVKSLPPEALTFYTVLLLLHILLSGLLLSCGDSLMGLLQTIKGVTPPASSPDGDLSGLYPLLVWLLLAAGMGILQFLLAVIFTVRDSLRRVMGYIPREKRKKNGD